MMRHFGILVAVFLMTLSTGAEAQTTFSIVPQPDSVKLGRGNFVLSNSTVIASGGGLGRLAGYLKEQIGIFTHLKLKQTHAGAKNAVVLVLDKSFKGPDAEAYSLDVTPEKVVLKAGAEVGLFRGIQTLLQIIPLPDSSKNGSFMIRSCSVKDHPRFGWRGLNLDCVRHFMTKDFIKRYIDLLAYYKFNVFHWHLTDDQGWRIQIKKYPRLTEVGAWRTEADGQKYGGYYTQKDIKEIVAYAKSRYITVVPEIEMPGHCLASLASYPENACVPGPFQVGIQWGVYKDIYDPAKASTYTFLENVLTEVMKLFPSHYIHIGGDEVPKVEWKENAGCQKLMKEKGLKNEEELQSYFIRRIQKFVESKGRQIIGWDEILEGKGPGQGGVVESWRGIDGAIQAAAGGHYTILAPGEYTYLSRDPEDLSLDSVYSFNPVPSALTPAQRKYVMGTEASMWSEHAPQETVDSKMFPRLLAMAEDAWTAQGRKNYADFHERLQAQYARLTYLGVDYGLERKAISYKTTFDKEKKEFVITLSPTQAGIAIRYTVGDTLDLADSHLYTHPVVISSTATFLTQAEMNGRLVGNPISLSFITDKALNAGVKVEEPYAPQYAAGGVESLVDGIRGTVNYNDGLWLGYKGTDLNAVIDLKKEETLSEAGAGFYQSIGSYIFLPSSVQFLVSKDGIRFESVGVAQNVVPEKDPDTVIKDFTVTFKPTEARYVKMVAKSIGVCPPWHIGAGHKAWLFIDEIFAN